jgi:MoxR-like ATPase
MEDEMKVIGLTTTTATADLRAVTTSEEILSFQELVRMVPIADEVARYAVSVVRASRPTDDSAPDAIKKYVNFGASVRGAQFLVLTAKARALMSGRHHVTFDDIAKLAKPILRHRILLNFQAESERLTPDMILDRLLEAVPRSAGN